MSRLYTIVTVNPRTGERREEVMELTDEQVAELTQLGATLHASKDVN